MHYSITVLAVALALPASVMAEASRGLGAHIHGSGELNIAVEGNTIAMELDAPGADIVGFEYAATSDSDRAAVDAAISDLARPLNLFVFPPRARCTVTAAKVALVTGDNGADLDGEKVDHGHEAHEDDDHVTAGHTEFRAEYVISCARPARIDHVDFAYFGRFPNARELDVQMVSAAGARSVEVGRESPVLDLRGMF